MRDEVYAITAQVEPFALYGALSAALPEIHGAGLGLVQRGRFLVVRGKDAPRLPVEVRVNGRAVRLTFVDRVPLRPATRLLSPIVVVKTTGCGSGSPDFAARVAAELDRQLAALAPTAKATVGKDRPTVRVHGRRIVGVPVTVDCLPGDSIAIQVAGLGGKRSMGCGVFFPEGWTWP